MTPGTARHMLHNVPEAFVDRRSVIISPLLRHHPPAFRGFALRIELPRFYRHAISAAFAIGLLNQYFPGF
jgi:hypothetical protein